jgi:hypothetical protein
MGSHRMPTHPQYHVLQPAIKTLVQADTMYSETSAAADYSTFKICGMCYLARHSGSKVPQGSLDKTLGLSVLVDISRLCLWAGFQTQLQLQDSILHWFLHRPTVFLYSTQAYGIDQA